MLFGKHIIMKTMDEQYGLTLIELLIITSITAVLLLVAIPGYQSYVIESKMKEASLVTLKDAHFMEKWYGSHGKYTTGNSWPTLPYLVSPESGAPLYKIALTPTGSYNPANDNSYTIRATPICNTVVANSGCVCIDQDHNVKLATNSNCNNSNSLCPCINN